MTAPWHPFCLKEIDYAVSKGRKRLSAWEKDFLKTVRPRIENGLDLSPKQEDCLTKLHQRITEPSRVKW